jgi:hypothetical protein
MIRKHTITMPKPWPNTGSFGLHLHELVARLRNAFNTAIPAGYQDETGFHLGVQPEPKEGK